MTPDKIKEFWLTLATFRMANKRDYELYSKLIFDAFNAKDGTDTYKLALLMIKGMMQQASPTQLDAFLGTVMVRITDPKEQARFINQVTVAAHLVVTIEKCEDLYQSLITSNVPPKRPDDRGMHLRNAHAH